MMNAAGGEARRGSHFHKLTQDLVEEYERMEALQRLQSAEILRLRAALGGGQPALGPPRGRQQCHQCQSWASDESSEQADGYGSALPWKSNGSVDEDQQGGQKGFGGSWDSTRAAPGFRQVSWTSSLASELSQPPEPEAPPSPRSPPITPARPKGADRSLGWDVFEDDGGRVSGLSLVSRASKSTTTYDSSSPLLQPEDANHLVVLLVWRATRSNSKRQVSRGATAMLSSVRDKPSEIEADERTWPWCTLIENLLQRLVVKPESRLSLAWDLVTVCMLVYDIIVIPLLAYDLPPSLAWDVLEILLTSMWTLDLVFTFFRGFEQGGSVETRIRKIAYKYVSTWFAFDAVIILIDWVLWGVSNGDLLDMLRVSRIRRLLRFLRLMRLVRHGRRLISGLKSEFETTRVVMRIVWLLLILVIINHFVSCAWYAIGMVDTFDAQWTNRFAEDDTLAYRYATSFHWSVTQFTPASMEVTPANVLERCYNIVIIFFGLLMFSSFVSSMTNSMTYLQKMNNEKHEQKQMVRQYISDRGLSLELGASILRHVHGASSQRRGLVEADIPCLRNLPRELRELLHVEVYSRWLNFHTLFKTLSEIEPRLFMTLCQGSMTERALAPGDELFRFGAKCSNMYFVIKGSVSYVFGYGELEQASTEVGVRQWLSEPALWVKWNHQGRAYATCSTASDLVVLISSEFHTLFANCGSRFQLQHYARLYAFRAECENGGAEYISDVWGQRPQISELVNQVFEQRREHDEKKIILMLSDQEFSPQRVFQAWRKLVVAARG